MVNDLITFISVHPDIHNVLNILLAAVMGGILGLERDIHGRAAGLRTHLFVCVGSAAFTILSIHASSLGIAMGANITDPGRIAAQIVVGIGFLGAGTIIKDGFSVRGLTTAACLWITSSIGMACGYSQYTLVGIITLITLIGLMFLGHIDRLYSKNSYRILSILIPIDTNMSSVIKTIKHRGIKIRSVDYKKDYEKKTILSRFVLTLSNKGNTDKDSHQLILDLENKFPLKRIIWGHKEI